MVDLLNNFVKNRSRLISFLNLFTMCLSGVNKIENVTQNIAMGV